MLTVQVAATGCGKDQGTQQAPSAAAAPQTAPPERTPQQNTLQVQVDRLPRFLNPLVTHDRWCHWLTMNTIFEPLVRVNNSGGFRPHLAASIQLLDRGRRVRLTLRKGLLFHDGRPLTSADVKYTLDKVQARNSPSPLLRAELADVREVRLAGTQAVDLVLARVNHLLLAVLAEIPILPAHLYSRRGLRNGKLNQLPVGSGPLQVESRDEQNTLELVRNDNYWGTPARVPRLVFRAMPDPARALAALRNGEIHMISNLYRGYYPKEVSRGTMKQRFKVLRIHPYRMRLLMFNTRRRALKDRRVRLALVRLADRQRMVLATRKGMGQVLSAPLWPLSPWYNTTIHPYAFNRKAAARLLDAAGWRARRARRQRQRMGWPLKLGLMHARKPPAIGQLAGILKEELDRAGFVINVKPGDFGYISAQVHKGKFDLALVGLAPRQESDLSPYLHSKGALNFGGYNNPAVDALLKALRTTRATELRLPLARRLHRLLHDDPPYVVLYQPIELMMASRRVRGLANNGRWPQLATLWLSSATRRRGAAQGRAK